MSEIEVTRAPIGYALQVSCSHYNPVDATTYYFGSGVGNQPDTVAIKKNIYIPRAGTIRYISLFFSNNTGNGTTETSTVSFRLNNTTDTTISSVVDNSGSFTVNRNDLPIKVAAGDFFEIKWVTPTWVTNPQGVRLAAVIYIEA